MLNVIMLNVIMLNGFTLSVVAPLQQNQIFAGEAPEFPSIPHFGSLTP
jgi:hypothetical protein